MVARDEGDLLQQAIDPLSRHDAKGALFRLNARDPEHRREHLGEPAASLVVVRLFLAVDVPLALQLTVAAGIDPNPAALPALFLLDLEAAATRDAYDIGLAVVELHVARYVDVELAIVSTDPRLDPIVIVDLDRRGVVARAPGRPVADARPAEGHRAQGDLDQPQRGVFGVRLGHDKVVLEPVNAVGAGSAGSV